LYNGEDQLNHVTRGYARNIKNPRLSILAAGHTHKLIGLIETEKDVQKSSDGFVSRLLILNPKPSELSLSICDKQYFIV